MKSSWKTIADRATTACIPRERFDGMDAVKTVLQAVKQTNERFGLSHLVNVIRGIEDEYVKSYGHFDLADLWKGRLMKKKIFGNP